MQKYESIERAIKEKDIERLRQAVCDIAFTCRDFSDGEFDEAIRYVESKGIDLKGDNKLVGKLVSEEKKPFTKDDFAMARFYLGENFCDARIAYLKRIARALYGKPHTGQQTTSQTPVTDSRGGGSKNSVSRQRKNRGVLAAAVILVAAAVITAVVISSVTSKETPENVTPENVEIEDVPE